VERSLPAPRIIGHRGAAAHAPENTLAGFRKARQLGAQWVEFDVQATRDGCPILLHDARLERTTDGYGVAADRSADEIERLDAGSWFGSGFRGEKVPRLDQALALIDELGLGAVIEVKARPGDGARTMHAVLETLRASALAHSHIVSSFDEEALAAAAAEAPAIPRALIVKSIPKDWRHRIDRLDCGALHVGERALASAHVAEIARRCALRTYTVNTPDRAREVFSWGAAAVFTDCPDVLLSAVGHNSDGSALSGPRGSNKQ
jgi:glycerophosphoryl diester phosphodiesterase